MPNILWSRCPICGKGSAGPCFWYGFIRAWGVHLWQGSLPQDSQGGARLLGRHRGSAAPQLCDPGQFPHCLSLWSPHQYKELVKLEVVDLIT